MGYKNFSAKISWNKISQDGCEYTGRWVLCCPVEFTYYLGNEKHTQEYTLSTFICSNIDEGGSEVIQEIFEAIKEQESLG